jgi:hypothetical protein
MGGGGGSMPMMSSLSSCVLSVCVVAGGGWLLYSSAQKKKQEEADRAAEQAAVASATSNTEETTSSTTTKSGPGERDGVWTLMVGGNALESDRRCDSTEPQFNIPTDSKSQWYIRKAGTDASGKDFYTIQSQHRMFNMAGCKANYLTSNGKCNASPTLADAKYGNPAQYWYINAEGQGVTIQNVACAMGQWPSYLIGSGQLKSKPMWQSRTGTQFTLQKPYMQ